MSSCDMNCLLNHMAKFWSSLLYVEAYILKICLKLFFFISCYYFHCYFLGIPRVVKGLSIYNGYAYARKSLNILEGGGSQHSNKLASSFIWTFIMFKCV